ncbi:ABC-2 type transport system permease protein [Apibacter mensalis]|uniref:ABC-2 type transport system permease protein n=1 Tax=Apibacter mensalis TaxID=1586267 RepID=A0A0X3AMM8_9FLAO|nr:ABC-2 type transport system permease protein [Apibacter mensalis]
MQKGFFSIFISEMQRLLTSPRLIFLAVILPCGLFLYYASLLQDGVPRKFPVVLLDQDKSNTSRKLGRMLNATSSLDIVAEVENEKDGEKMIRTDKAFALLIIPRNFEDDIYRNIDTQVVCYYNNNYLLAGGLINKAFQSTVGSFAAQAHINGLTQKGLTQKQAIAAASPIITKQHILFNPYTNYSYYLTIALMPMSLQIIMMVVSIYVLGSVLKDRKGRELFVRSKGNVWVSFWAKILPYTILFSIIGFFMNSLLYYKLGVPLRGNFIIVNIYFIVFVIVCQLFGLFYVSFNKDLRSALTLGGSYSAIAFSFTGYTFPKEGLPNIIQYLSYTFPFTSYLRFIIDYAIRGIAIGSLNFGYIIAFMVFCLLGILSMPKYNRLLKQGGYYV